MKEGAPESEVNSSRLKKQKQSALIKQIDGIIANNRTQTYRQFKTGELVYIISEKQLKEIQTSLKLRDSLSGINIQSINTRLVDDSQISDYTYYDHHLRPQISQQNQDQQLKIMVLNKKIHSQLMKMATNMRWIVLERKIIKIKGQKQLQINPFRIQIELISMKSINQAEQRCKRQNRSLAEGLNFQKIKLNFYYNQTIEQLLARLRNVLKNANNQFRIYAYDSTLFSQSSFLRTLEYFYKKQNTKYPINQQQLNFYKLQEKQNQMGSHILQFFPGKLLSKQSVSQIKEMKIQKLVLQIKDEDWMFPDQPTFSVAKHCRFCMFKMQLYKDFQCNQCGQTYLFCSKICHYQFLMDHSCSQAKEQIRQIYGQQYLNKQKTVYLPDKLKTSDVVVQKKDVISLINSNSSIFEDFKKNNSLNWGNAVNSLGGGMNNLGNTCYLNSSLQTLIRTSLTSMLLGMQREIKNNKKCKLSKAYLQLIKKMHKLAPSQSLDFHTMQSFKYDLQLSLVQFQGYAQHDAHQFIMFFLDKLSEQLNTSSKTITFKNEHSLLRGQDQILAKRHWLQLIQKNNSPIINLFYGQIKSQIDCPHCHTTNKTFDSFSILSLSIPQKNQSVTIQLFYETYMFKQKIKYLKLENPGNNVEQIIKNVMVRLGFPAEKSQLINAFLIGFQGKCPKIDKNKAVSELVPQLYTTKQLQNQLFLFETPNKQGSILLIKFLYQQKTFTFKKPLHFTQPKSKIRNYKIYNMITQYLTNLASHYLTQNNRNSKAEELKKKMQLKPQNYFSIRLVYPRDGKQKQTITLKISPDTQIQKELQKVIEVEVCIQRFDHFSNIDKQFFDIVMNKLNRFVKFSENPSSKIKNYLNQPPQVLEDCLREQFNRKQLLANGNEWFCSTCNEKRRVYKIAHLYKTNKYLFIQIKRFKQGADGKFYKNYSKVSPPLELDLHRILENPTLPEAYYKDISQDQLKRYNLPKEINQKDCYMYNLIGIILHEGKLGSGHYTALFKSKEWLQYNDLTVSKIDIQKILKQSKTMEKVYILLYQRAQ